MANKALSATLEKQLNQTPQDNGTINIIRNCLWALNDSSGGEGGTVDGDSVSVKDYTVDPEVDVTLNTALSNIVDYTDAEIDTLDGSTLMATDITLETPAPDTIDNVFVNMQAEIDALSTPAQLSATLMKDETFVNSIVEKVIEKLRSVRN